MISAAATHRPNLFYKSGKPYARWWWFATEMKKEGIAADLAWLKKMGFGGVEVAWISPSDEEKARLPRPPKWPPSQT